MRISEARLLSCRYLVRFLPVYPMSLLVPLAYADSSGSVTNPIHLLLIPPTSLLTQLLKAFWRARKSYAPCGRLLDAFVGALGEYGVVMSLSQREMTVVDRAQGSNWTLPRQGETTSGRLDQVLGTPRY